MTLSESKALEPEDRPSSSLSSSGTWKERVFVPTILAGIIGGGVGLVSRHRKVHGLSNISATYATNFSIVTGCYCVAREFVISSRKADPYDLLNSGIAGLLSGAVLGRLQGGRVGAAKYAAVFAVAGTALDFSYQKVRASLREYTESMTEEKNKSFFKVPDWSPIQVLDDEQLAAKEAREKKLYAQRFGDLNNKES